MPALLTTRPLISSIGCVFGDPLFAEMNEDGIKIVLSIHTLVARFEIPSRRLIFQLT